MFSTPQDLYPTALFTDYELHMPQLMLKDFEEDPFAGLLLPDYSTGSDNSGESISAHNDQPSQSSDDDLMRFIDELSLPGDSKRERAASSFNGTKAPRIRRDVIFKGVLRKCRKAMQTQFLS